MKATSQYRRSSRQCNQNVKIACEKLSAGLNTAEAVDNVILYEYENNLFLLCLNTAEAVDNVILINFMFNY